MTMILQGDSTSMNLASTLTNTGPGGRNQSILAELRVAAPARSANITLRDSDVISLANTSSSAITMPTNFWGKSSALNGAGFYHWPNAVQTSASTYTFTVGPGVTQMDYLIVGPGGGGAGGDWGVIPSTWPGGSSIMAGGGGAGGRVTTGTIPVSSGTVLVMTMWPGGKNSPSIPSSSGGISTYTGMTINGTPIYGGTGTGSGGTGGDYGISYYGAYGWYEQNGTGGWQGGTTLYNGGFGFGYSDRPLFVPNYNIGGGGAGGGLTGTNGYSRHGWDGRYYFQSNDNVNQPYNHKFCSTTTITGLASATHVSNTTTGIINWPQTSSTYFSTEFRTNTGSLTKTATAPIKFTSLINSNQAGWNQNSANGAPFNMLSWEPITPGNQRSFFVNDSNNASDGIVLKFSTYVKNTPDARTSDVASIIGLVLGFSDDHHVTIGNAGNTPMFAVVFDLFDNRSTAPSMWTGVSTNIVSGRTIPVVECSAGANLSATARPTSGSAYGHSNVAYNSSTQIMNMPVPLMNEIKSDWPYEPGKNSLVIDSSGMFDWITAINYPDAYGWRAGPTSAFYGTTITGTANYYSTGVSGSFWTLSVNNEPNLPIGPPKTTGLPNRSQAVGARNFFVTATSTSTNLVLASFTATNFDPGTALYPYLGISTFHNNCVTGHYGDGIHFTFDLFSDYADASVGFGEQPQFYHFYVCFRQTTGPYANQRRYAQVVFGSTDEVINSHFGSFETNKIGQPYYWAWPFPDSFHHPGGFFYFMPYNDYNNCPGVTTVIPRAQWNTGNQHYDFNLDEMISAMFGPSGPLYGDGRFPGYYQEDCAVSTTEILGVEFSIEHYMDMSNMNSNSALYTAATISNVNVYKTKTTEAAATKNWEITMTPAHFRNALTDVSALISTVTNDTTYYHLTYAGLANYLNTSSIHGTSTIIMSPIEISSTNTIAGTGQGGTGTAGTIGGRNYVVGSGGPGGLSYTSSRFNTGTWTQSPSDYGVSTYYQPGTTITGWGNGGAGGTTSSLYTTATDGVGGFIAINLR